MMRTERGIFLISILFLFLVLSLNLALATSAVPGSDANCLRERCDPAERACLDKADSDYSACDPIRAGPGGSPEQVACYGAKKSDDKACTDASTACAYTCVDSSSTDSDTTKTQPYDSGYLPDGGSFPELKVLAGSIDQIRGVVEVREADGSWRKLKNGDTINTLDRIRTREDGRLRIVLLDETHFTLGPKSDVVIDKFVYDPYATSDISVKVTKGLFRWVTAVAQKVPSRVNIRLPAGMIGPRGTDFVVSYDSETAISSVYVFEGAVVFNSTITGLATEINEGESATFTGENFQFYELSQEYWDYLLEGIEPSEFYGVSFTDSAITIITLLILTSLVGAVLYFLNKKRVPGFYWKGK